MDTKKEKKNIITKILLIIIIILLLLLTFEIRKLLSSSKEDKIIPNGNVDIFEINCDYNCDCNTNSNENEVTEENAIESESSSTNYSTSSNIYGSSNTNDSNDDGDLIVSDNDITWQSTNTLKIFENPMYNDDTIIAPESTNIYQFVIKNNTSYNINYTINFSEINEENINMKYRLIQNGEYVAGTSDTWVSYSKLLQSEVYLTTSSSTTYYLEWKWFSSDNDTEVGIKGDVTYTLNIEIEAYSI